MKFAKQLLALLLCLLLLGSLALPAFAAAPQTAAVEEAEEDPADAGEDASVLISTSSDLLSRMEFFLSHSGLFLRMRLVSILNFFRGLFGKEPILL
ncbi:MAG: hypothetical protein IK080_06415 [Clostridia bacterium]|nr:hypothetical protein [Clostridia bacterium]